jgi:hypothetical protein
MRRCQIAENPRAVYCLPLRFLSKYSPGTCGFRALARSNGWRRTCWGHLGGESYEEVGCDFDEGHQAGSALIKLGAAARCKKW